MGSEEFKVDASLDAVGLYCPAPIVLTTEKMHELEDGDVLEVLADDPEVLSDFPAWCKTTGHKFLKVEKENGIFKLYLQKSDDRGQKSDLKRMKRDVWV